MLVLTEEADAKLTFADREAGLAPHLTVEDFGQPVGLLKTFPEEGLFARSDGPMNVGLLAVNLMQASIFHQGMCYRLISSDGL